jgi:hypothetical protein
MPELERFNIPPHVIIKYKAESNGKISLIEPDIKDLIRIAKDAFRDDMPDKDVRSRVTQNSVLLIANRDNIIVGFEASGYSIHQRNELYIAAVAVASSEQGQGLFRKLNKIVIEDGLNQGFTNITAYTQNPNVDKGMIATLDTLKGERQFGGYTIMREKHEKHYTGLLTRERQFSKTDESMNKIYAELNSEKGDAYFLTFSVKRG